MYRFISLLIACVSLVFVTSFNAQSVAEQPKETPKAETQPKDPTLGEVLGKIADWVREKSAAGSFRENMEKVQLLGKKLAQLKDASTSRESEEIFFRRFSAMRQTVAKAVFAEVAYLSDKQLTSSNNGTLVGFFSAQKNQLIAEGQSSIDQLFAAREQESVLRVVRLQQSQAFELVAGNMFILSENLDNLSLAYVLTKIAEAHAKVDAALQISATKKT